jgi:hypothetical protein
MLDEPKLNKEDFPRPFKFLHYKHPELGTVCIDECCEHVKTADPHRHPEEQQYYGPTVK